MGPIWPASPCMVTKSRLQSWEIHPKPLLSLHRKEQLAGCSLGHRLYFCVSKPSSAVVTWSRNRLSSDQWILRHILKFQLRRAKRHAKRDRRCRPDNSGRLLTLLDWYQTVSNCSCWQTSIWQPVLFEYGTGCEWYPANQTLQCPVVTVRCYPWSAGSWQVFHIVGLCVFSQQSADYSIVVAHLTYNSFEGHPCCMHADYLPSLCFWYSPSYHAYW